MSSEESPRVQKGAEAIKNLIPKDEEHPKIAMVLGSGLGDLAERIDVRARVSYSNIPGFLPSTVEGHPGELYIGKISNVQVAIMAGRIHLYEGHSPNDVVLPVRVLTALGAKTLIITNAAGGIRQDLRPGQLMALTDHLNLTGRNPLVGANEDALGPRFPDMSEAYDRNLRSIAASVARTFGIELKEGVYAGLLGPTYETPAEIRMLKTIGADAVGMSTVLEVIAARHMGAKILGISCISNLAAGYSDKPLSHEEVKETADGAKDGLFRLIAGVVEQIETP